MKFVKDKGEIFCRLVHLAVKNGITVKFVPFRAYDGRIKGDRIGIRQSLGTIDEFNYNLAHELAHAYLHYDKGSLMDIDEKVMELYEEQADQAARMILEVLSSAETDCSNKQSGEQVIWVQSA